MEDEEGIKDQPEKDEVGQGTLIIYNFTQFDTQLFLGFWMSLISLTSSFSTFLLIKFPIILIFLFDCL